MDCYIKRQSARAANFLELHDLNIVDFAICVSKNKTTTVSGSMVV